MKAFLRKQETPVAEFDDSLVRRLVEKVTVYEGRFVVTFRSGVEVEENQFVI
jgi:site-specific DNA recombinase